MNPILFNPQSFDANTDEYVFAYSCDTDVLSAKLTIRDNASLAIVHVCEVQGSEDLTYPAKKEIAGNTKLRNGVKYNAFVEVTYKGGAKETSNIVTFYCIKAPTFKFQYNGKDLLVGENNVIDSLNPIFTVEYKQDGVEILEHYQLFLYNSALSCIYSSSETGIYEDRYGLSDEHTFPTFNNRDTYYIQAKGATVNGFIVDTGMIMITPKVELPKNYATIYLKNNEQYGYIDYSTNLVIIQPDEKSSNYTFVEGNIDLRDNYRKVEYSKGFTINNDFALWLKGSGFSEHIPNHRESVMATSQNVDHTLLTIHNGQAIVNLEVHPYDEELYRFALFVNDTPEELEHPLIRCCFSKPFPIDDEDIFLICIKSYKGTWGLYVQLEDASEHQANYWIGNVTPTKNLRENDIWIDVGSIEIDGQQEPDSLKYLLRSEVSLLYNLSIDGESEESIRAEIDKLNLSDEEKEEMFNQRFEALCQRLVDNYDFEENAIWLDGR